ncbi:tyrosine-type recombinase/integrase [Rhodobacter sp. HX-7-19]|uniref:Tyrosine-type recombinase/integrase n=1 Tax=Paragemmobacter kunshanensis TaxID=2583234 RepID=A0A6M1TTT4_9RHOB|nr:tyrosine-type recombinase/integrase [Rhodobacter kunshanensis]NGQ89282.1 tyrosine-type recombinase/integrase [Rhodobacter kunshanensis]
MHSPHGKPSVKVVLKGVHKVKRRLASGETKTHHYAWRGGPRIEAEPDTPEFIAEFQRLTADRDRPTHHDGTFQFIINAYQRSPAFKDLAEATRSGYVRRIRKVEKEFGDLPIKVLDDPRIRGEALDWRDRIAVTAGTREADYCLTVMARIVSWAHDRRTIRENHLARPGRLHKGSRVDIIWSDTEVEAFLAVAEPHVALPFLIALSTAQRETDILRLTWKAYDGEVIRLRQSKGGKWLTVPLTVDLRAVLDAAKAKRTGPVICVNSRGKPWTLDGYKTSFGKAKAAAKIENRTFHDTRGTAVVNLALSGCTVPEICSITGHSPTDANSILSKHYLGPDRRLAESAIGKLETWQKGKAEA